MKPNTDYRNADPFSRCSAIVCLLSSTPVSQSLELVIACDCENLPPRFFVEKDGRTRRTCPATRVLTFFVYCVVIVGTTSNCLPTSVPVRLAQYCTPYDTYIRFYLVYLTRCLQP